MYFIIILLLNLNHAQYTQLFHDDMESINEWIIDGDTFTSTCNSDPCFALGRNSKITYNGIDAQGYRNITLVFDILPSDVELNDYCEALYSINGVNFTSIKTYASSLNNIITSDVLPMEKDADNQISISIRFAMIGILG